VQASAASLQNAGGGERVVARSMPAKNWFGLWDTGPSWSPDGRRIALCGGEHGASGDRAVIFDVRLDEGAMATLPTPPWTSIEHAQWRRDGTGLVVVAAAGDSKPTQVWDLDASTGRARRITNDVNDYQKITLSADSRLVAVEQRASFNHLWVIAGGDTAPAKQLTFGSTDSDGYYGVAWTPEGRIVFVSNRTGQYEIWSMNADGSDPRQLTMRSPGPNYAPRPTPDGRIAFASSRTGRSHIWRMDGDGRNVVQLTGRHSQVQPDVSADGRWVYYVDVDVAPAAIERVSIEGGAAERLPRPSRATTPALSPDGTTLAYNQYDGGGWHNAIMSTAGGPPRVFDWNSVRGIVHWAPDGSALIYADSATKNNLWL